VLDQENWQALPIPEGYQFREISSPLSDFPNIDNYLNVFNRSDEKGQ
jgi:hypothetical protein